MASSDIEISSNALLLIGDDSISAYNETRGGIIAQSLFENVAQNMLSIHLWRFAIKQFDLNLLTSTPASDSPYQYAFQLPAGYIRAVQTFPSVPYEILEDEIHANVNRMTLEYLFRADTGAWPPWFVKLMEYQMAAELSNPVTEDAARAKFWENKAQYQLMVAQSIDSQQRPNVAIQHNPLIEAHR